MTEDRDGAKPVQNYPSNSHTAREKDAAPEKEAPKAQKKIIEGEVIQRKKPLGRRIAETFTGDDMHSVGHYVLFEVMLPAAKNTISEVVSQGVERLLFGEARPRGGSSGIRTSYTSYNSMYRGNSQQRQEPVREISRRARASHDFAEVVLATRGDADDVLDRLSDLVNQYGEAKVSDLYDLVGITGSFTDEKWGWQSLAGSRIHPVREGFLLDLPRPMPLD